MSGPIFGNSSSVPGSSGGNRHLVEFRAGRMNMVGKMVHPDTRKGLVYLYQAEDALIHFCWKDRTSGKVEDDLIIFPDDCEFKRIEQCKTGRVYLLKFKSSSRRLFFWIQESKTEKDDEYCRRVNEIMNNPPSANSISTGRGGDNDMQYVLNNLSQQQLMQLFGGVGQMGGLSSLLGSMNRPSESSTRSTASRTTTASTTTGTPTTPANTTTTTAAAAETPRAPARLTSRRSDTESSGNGTSGSTPRVLLSELQSYLSGLKTNDQTGETSVIGGRSIDLSTAINAETVNNIVSDEDRVNALLAHLPTIDGAGNDKQKLKETISSPQFLQALSLFSSALQSGQMGPVVSQFQLSPEAVAAANTGDLEQFVKALEKISVTEKSTTAEEGATGKTSDKEEEKDADVNMEEPAKKSPEK